MLPFIIKILLPFEMVDKKKDGSMNSRDVFGNVELLGGQNIVRLF